MPFLSMKVCKCEFFPLAIIMKSASCKSNPLPATKRKLNTSTSSFKDRVSSARSSPKASDCLVPNLQLSTSELPASTTSTAASHRQSQRSLPQSPRYFPCLQALYSSIRTYVVTTAPYLSTIPDQSLQEANYRLEQNLRAAESLLTGSGPFAASAERTSEAQDSERAEEIGKLEVRMSGLIGEIEKGVERTREKVQGLEGQWSRRDQVDYKELCVRLEAALKRHQNEADTIQRLHHQELEDLKSSHSLQLHSLQSTLETALKGQESLSNSQENVRNLMRELKKANETIENLEKWQAGKREMEAKLREIEGENRYLRTQSSTLQASNQAFSQQLAAYRTSMSTSVADLSKEVRTITKKQERLETREERLKMTISDLESGLFREKPGETLRLPTQISPVRSLSHLNEGDISLSSKEDTEYDLSGMGRMAEEPVEDHISLEKDSFRAYVLDFIGKVASLESYRELQAAVERIQRELRQ